jgi:hypothetical protein
MIEKLSVGVWLFLAIERLMDELENYMQRNMEFFLHSIIGVTGRF